MNHASDPRLVSAFAADVTPASAPRLTISVIGGARFHYAGQEVQFRNRKTRAVLAYLALSHSANELRERIAGRFWSESSEFNARATLRQAVHELRETLDAVECSALAISRLSIGLRPGSFRVDLDDLLAAVAVQDVPEVLLRQPRLPETLLAGFDDLDPSFHLWLTEARQSLHEQLIRPMVDGYRDTALDPERRCRMARAVMLLDPTHEEACRMVMRSAAEAGEAGAAIRAFDELQKLLHEEYDVSPSLATQALVAEIKQGRYGPPTTRPPVTLAPPPEDEPPPATLPTMWAEANMPLAVAKPILFVNPFITNSVDDHQMPLLHGFRLELIGCLARFREWYVAGADIAIGRGEVVPPLHPGATRYTLNTVVYQTHTTFNVVMVLQEQPGDVAIWGERFTLPLQPWFETQQRTIRRIAATLRVQVSTERLVRLSHVPDTSLNAYDAWLRGQWLASTFQKPESNRAIACFGRGMEAAPAFAPFYISRAEMDIAAYFRDPGRLPDGAAIEQTITLARQALILDPRDARAELCLGRALAMAGHFAAAQLHIDLALTLNPHDPWMLVSAAKFHAFCGEFQRARALSAQAFEATLSPTLGHWAYEVSIRFLNGDYQGALTATDRAQNALPTLAAWRAATLWRLGRGADARHSLDQFYARARANWHGAGPATDQAIVTWFLRVYPLASDQLWDRLRNSLAAVGAPVEDLTFSVGSVASGAPA